MVGGLTFASIDPGYLSTCGVTTSGEGYCWGQNDFGELGLGFDSDPDIPTPQPVIGGHVFQDIRSGFAHACGVTTSGEGLCWGLNVFGALGIGSFTGIRSTPQLVVGSYTWDRIDTGFRFSCGETSSAEVYCWGENTVGALGDGTGVNSPSPVLALDRTP